MSFAGSSSITSRQNPLCKLVRSLHARKGRELHQLLLAEGQNSVTSALRAGWAIQDILAAEGMCELSPEIVETSARQGVHFHSVAEEVLAYLADAETSPGVLALVQLPSQSGENEICCARGLTVLLDGVADPGNVGTLIRSADAVGAGALALTSGSADAYGPKAVRASAGSVFHFPEITQIENQKCKAQFMVARVPVVVAAAHGGESCFEFNWPERCALVLGNEKHGVSSELTEAATSRITIPIFGRAESLNVAAAGAILMYAWRAHRTG